ncbi:thiol peroxidase [Flavobacterium terrigena]|uniref:Thiol peroxidase n=1 Tax=Flavobacterium terrigena TaxID=402734 RepID=A0A1H6QLG4_9FLAO|nr:thiol peroxidase [Flavobacterium terrigena]SEI40977.1 thiol peroxidase, atypical 2-Cys peroxiredoxin [Flavobacterium terrigena]
MSTVTLGGNPVHTNATLPAVGSVAPQFQLVANDLSDVTLQDYKGQRVILNIFPSIDTATCATSVRTFNKMANDLENTKVLCISRDLPFAQKRFCGSEGLENVVNLSDFRDGSFGNDYGLTLTDSALKGLHARAIVVVDENGVVSHTELVSEIANEPNYEAALKAL